MPLRRISATHYRSFEDLDLELRPLTLLYGDNSAGKSSLLRLLPLLAVSFTGRGAPLDLTSAVAAGAGFDDLIGARWRGDNPTVQLGLRWEDDLGVNWNLGNLPTAEHRRRPVLLDLTVTKGSEVAHARDPRSDHPTGETTIPLDRIPMERLRPRDGEGLFRLAGDRLEELVHRVAWLSADRAELPRTLPNPVFEANTLQPDGGDALAALAVLPEVESEVRTWLERECQRSLERQGSGESERWTLAPSARRELAVPLREAGLGLGHLLPELVALALRRSPRRPSGATVLCLEEPATHLHERLQVAVGRHLAAVAAEEDPPLLVVETHSRALLAGVQLALSRGQLSPDRVILHWVEQDALGASLITPVRFAASGLPLGHRLSTTFLAEADALSEIAERVLRGRG